MNRNRLKLTAVFALAALILVISPASKAQTSINVGTAAAGSASYNPFSASGGPFPFTNFGVQAGVNLGGTNVNLNLGGLTNFLLPQFNSGQVLTPGSSGASVGYTPGWTGNLAATSTLAANVTFVYNIGPFSGSDNIFNQNLVNPLGGNLASGGALVGGSSVATANGNLFGLGYSASAPFASASATINVGLQYQSSLAWNPATSYGVNSWLSAAPNGAALGPTTTSSVSSGGLNYIVPTGAGLTTGEQLYINLQPTVDLNMAITPVSAVSTPISGNLNVQAFGNTIANYNFPIANPFTLPIGYTPWDASASWDSGTVLSIPVLYASSFNANGISCPIGALCNDFVVDDPSFTFQVPTLGNGGLNDLTGGGVSGGWNPTVNGSGMVPTICDPNNDTCYASNDPNLPVGQGSVMTNVTQLTTTPEPGTFTLFGCGILALAFGQLLRRKRNAPPYLAA